jgi:hypothetical protein
VTIGFALLLGSSAISGPLGPDLDPVYFVEGASTGDHFGKSVAALPDLDGDGVGEILVGAPHRAPLSKIGHAYVLSGASGEILRWHGGSNYGDRFGHAVSTIGDLDADGVTDYAVGAIWALASEPDGASYPGRVTIYASGDGAILDFVDGVGKFECFGSSLATLPDADGDGVSEFAVGVRFGGAVAGDPATAPGHVRIVSGATRETFAGVSGLYGNDWLGFSSASVGDLDGDGLADLAAGGYAYPAGGFRGQVALVSSAGGDVLERFDGIEPSGWFGYSVAPAPDLDGDGVGDVAVGLPGALGTRGALQVVSSASGAVLFERHGNTSGECHGWSVAEVGDQDADGVADLTVGAPHFAGDRGFVTVVSAGANGKVLGTARGFEPGDLLGEGLAGIADLDGDGRAEIAVGSLGAPAGDHVGRLVVYRVP